MREACYIIFSEKRLIVPIRVFRSERPYIISEQNDLDICQSDTVSLSFISPLESLAGK